jgi:hypothetical protein
MASTCFCQPPGLCSQRQRIDLCLLGGETLIAHEVLFLHGWQSVPGGVKPTFLAQHGHEVMNPKLPDEDFAEAVKIAQAEFDKHQPDVVVGSSRGAAVAMNINSGDARLVLLCPAWKRWGTARTVKANAVIPFVGHFPSTGASASSLHCSHPRTNTFTFG